MTKPLFFRGMSIAAVALLPFTLVVHDARGSCTDATEQPANAGTARQKAADQFVGEFRFAGGAAQRKALEAAIDDVVADMSFLARDIARKKLRQSNAIPTSIEITRDGDALAISFDERRYVAKLDGSTTEVVGITGDTLKYRIDVSGSGVQQFFDGEKGDRHNRFVVSGDTLELRTEVSSSQLPKSLQYRLTFKRSATTE